MMETQTTDQPIPDQPTPAAAPAEKVAKEKKTRKKRVTKANASKEVERQMLENMPEMLRKKWIALGKALDSGEKWAVELIARQFEGDRGPGAVNIVSNTLNMTNGEQNTAGRSFESIIRKLEARDQIKILPQPTEIRRVDPDSDLPILDAEET